MADVPPQRGELIHMRAFLRMIRVRYPLPRPSWPCLRRLSDDPIRWDKKLEKG